MSEGLFGWLFGGALPSGGEQMRNVRPADPGCLELARGMAAVPEKEIARRNAEVWAREFAARSRPKGG